MWLIQIILNHRSVVQDLLWQVTYQSQVRQAMKVEFQSNPNYNVSGLI